MLPQREGVPLYTLNEKLVPNLEVRGILCLLDSELTLHLAWGSGGPPAGTWGTSPLAAPPAASTALGRKSVLAARILVLIPPLLMGLAYLSPFYLPPGSNSSL